MRTIQEVFDKVIGGYEPYTPERSAVYAGMCTALRRAWKGGEITENEYYLTLGEVEDHMRELARGKFCDSRSHFLAWILEDAGLDSSGKAQRAIYADWANRPRGGQ